MKTKIEKTLVFAITVVFCFVIGTISATEESVVPRSISNVESSHYTAVDAGVNKEHHLNAYADENTCSLYRPCKNGGTCSGYTKRCYCRYGFSGDFCEEIPECSSKCENRLELDCRYDVYERIVYCDCKNSSLFYDEEADICKPCSCENGYCTYEYAYPERKLVCRCPDGYKEFNGYCKECDCGHGSNGRCQFDLNGDKICNCLDGFYLREGRCVACNCIGGSSNPPTRCEVTGNVKHCFCPEGYEEVDESCHLIEINPCETNNTCHPSAKCYYRYDKIECECPKGYKGFFGSLVQPGELCEDINECQDLMHACWYPYRVDCVNIPGSYRCECMRGYKPDSYYQETEKVFCILTTVSPIPSVIVVFIAFSLIVVSCWMHIRVKKRATS